MLRFQEYGYEDARFENVVNSNFHCPICFNVLKEPKMCRSNQHVFCSACIERHLQNAATCPECMEELTVDTLNQAPRVYLNYLSELNINCDYFSRGCRNFIQLGDLQSHVTNCGFAPVKCSNDGCAVVVNKRDQIHHETGVCELRKVKCHDCGEIREEIEELKINLTKIKDEMKEMKYQLNQLTGMKVQITELMKEQLPLLKEDVIKEVRGVMGDVMQEIKLQSRRASNSCNSLPNDKHQNKHVNAVQMDAETGDCAIDTLSFSKNSSWATSKNSLWAPSKNSSWATSKDSSWATSKDSSCATSEDSSWATSKNSSCASSKNSQDLSKNSSCAPSKNSSCATYKDSLCAPSKNSSCAPSKKPSCAPSKNSSWALSKQSSLAPSKDSSSAPSKNSLRAIATACHAYEELACEQTSGVPDPD